MINSSANKTSSDIPPFMIKTNDRMSKEKFIIRVSVYSISLTGKNKSNFFWRVEIPTPPFPPKNVIFDHFSYVISTGQRSRC